jgi:hypothetical protein
MATLQQYSCDAAGRATPRNSASIRAAYRVGGIAFGLFSGADINPVLDPGLRNFAIESDLCDVQILVEWARDLKLPGGPPLFRSGGLWSLFEESGGYRFYFSTPSLGQTPYKAAWFDSEFRRGQVVLHRPYFESCRSVNPLEYPLDELAMIYRLSCGEGVEVHGCGVITPDGRGVLLTGHSGAGKSTSSRLWSKQNGARVLSDDRIILRREKGRVWMYGTPWHGDAGIAEADRWPLDGIFVLAHGDKNELRPLRRASASAELYARSFVPHHSPEAAAFNLEFFSKVTTDVPCFDFSFVPDITAVEALLREEFGKTAAA